MSFIKSLTKAQFKIDHASLQNRILILCALLLGIIIPWYFLVYSPQSEQASEVQDQISELQEKTDSTRAKYEGILNLVKNPNTAKSITKYEKIKQEIKVLNQETLHYHHTYIGDKELAKLLNSLLNDLKTVRIEHFSTLVVPPPAPVTTAASSKTVTPAVAATPTTPAIPAVPVQPKVSISGAVPSAVLPVMTRYTLSLKGDYFSIMHFLQRIESLKWQLFWGSLIYHVENHPEGIATIEFYTLKPGQAPVAPPKTGVAK